MNPQIEQIGNVYSYTVEGEIGQITQEDVIDQFSDWIEENKITILHERKIVRHARRTKEFAVTFEFETADEIELPEKPEVKTARKVKKND